MRGGDIIFQYFKKIQGKFLLSVIIMILFSTVSVSYLSITQITEYGTQNIEHMEGNMTGSHKNRLTGLTDTVYSLLSYYNDLANKGELTVDEAQKMALSRIGAMRYDDGSGYYWIHSAEDPKRPVMIMHPIKPQLNGTDLSNINDFDTVKYIFYKGEIHPKDAEIIKKNINPTDLFIKMNEVCIAEGAGFVKYYWSKTGSDADTGYPKLSYVKLFKPWHWVVGTGFYIDDIDEEISATKDLTIANVNNAKWKILSAAIMCLAAGIIMSLLLTSRLVKPLREIEKSVAQGDFTQELKVKTQDEIGSLVIAFNKMLLDLKKMIFGIKDNSDRLASYSQELASSSEEVTATMEEVSGTARELAAVSGKGAVNAESAAKESDLVRLVAEDGSAAVKATTAKMNRILASTKTISAAIQKLGDQSKQISQIINSITNIADQTNLLALNAAIEAARAGEHGRGFAVVAGEVRKLAEQSAYAAKEITALITEIQAGVEEAVNAMQKGSSDVYEGVETAAQAGAALERIMKAIEHNTSLIKDATSDFRLANEEAQQLLSSFEQITFAFEQVSDSAQELADIAGQLQNAIIKFRV